MPARSSKIPLLALLLLPIGPLSCGGPDSVNIQLRKDKQAMEEKIAALGRENEQLRSQIRSLESDVNSVETLPQDRLAQLFTVAGINIGRLTGRADGFAGLRVYVQPYDEDGDTIKAVGTVTVEAFDLAAGEEANVRVGRWTFDASENKRRWLSGRLYSGFSFECPWESAPGDGSDLLVKVTFADSLTGRQFEARREVE